MIRPHPSRCPACLGTGKLYSYSGADLRAVRKRAGVSLRDLARRLDLSAGYVCDVELGRRAVTERMLLAYKGLGG